MGVNETLRDPSVGLFIMAGRRCPPSAVLGRTVAAPSLKNEAVDMPSAISREGICVAQRNISAQPTIKNAMKDLPSALRRLPLEIAHARHVPLTYEEVHAGLETNCSLACYAGTSSIPSNRLDAGRMSVASGHN